MTVKLFNIGCTGNQGRSPPGEIITRNHLRSRKLLKLYNAISSGTSVDAIKSGKLSTGFMTQVVTQAYERGNVYSADQIARFDEAVLGDESVLKDLYDVAVARFGEEEHRYRAEVLPELGIEGKVKGTQDQLVARPDVVCVFPMAGRNAQQAEAIHQAAGYQPAPKQPEIGSLWVKDGSKVLIAIPTAYATGRPDFEVPNAFGGTKAAYQEGIEALAEYLPKAVDRFLEDAA